MITRAGTRPRQGPFRLSRGAGRVRSRRPFVPDALTGIPRSLRGSEWLGAALALAITTLPLCDGADDKLLKGFGVDIAELANVQAPRPGLVLPEF